MKYLFFEKQQTINDCIIAILIRNTDFHKKNILKYYINNPVSKLSSKSIIAFNLKYTSKNTCTAVQAREYLNALLTNIKNTGIKTLYVCDKFYFKILTKNTKIDSCWGNIYQCKIKGFEYINVILGLNYNLLINNPTLSTDLNYSLRTLVSHLAGTYTQKDQTIIHGASYPASVHDIEIALSKLHKYPVLTVDIETFSLNLLTAGLGTIAFAWDQHNGIAFPIDFDFVIASKFSQNRYKKKILVRKYLKKFFEEYTGTLIYHNQNFDAKILIYNLWMDDRKLNMKKLITGLKVMTGKTHDTKLIAYLAKNSTMRNILKLKKLAQEFTGNYAEKDINNILLIPKDKLLKYNLTDCLATWFVFNKYYPQLKIDRQLDIYNKIFLPSIKVILQMELIGMPMNVHTVSEVKLELIDIKCKYTYFFEKCNIILEYNKFIQHRAFLKKNLLLKTKIIPLENFKHIKFNPASNKQIQELLYDKLKLPILDTTKKGAASASIGSLKKLLLHITDNEIILLINNIIAFSEISVILNTFINVFMSKLTEQPLGSNIRYLYGNFNLGGTISGRLSSSKVNLQNLPSTGTKYAHIVKTCFEAPKGHLIIGADFSSLEDRISALTTKDKNKLKVYIQGYDGHCLRAYNYFKDQMPDIKDNIKSINSIKQKYPSLRQEAKAPTFALTYQGTSSTLIRNLNIEEHKAINIEKEYHKLYSESDRWIKNKLKNATITGYVTVAFGLRIRTPILGKTYLNKKYTPYMAAAEGRTVGNAFGQSYGLLNNRAAIEFQQRILASEYKYDIYPIAHIHDAMYFYIKDDIDIIYWFNINLIECMEWQELPELKHDKVKIKADISVFYPNWAYSFSIPNKASKATILKLAEAHKKSLLK